MKKYNFKRIAVIICILSFCTFLFVSTLDAWNAINTLSAMSIISAAIIDYGVILLIAAQYNIFKIKKQYENRRP
jgi:hypothetical protein